MSMPTHPPDPDDVLDWDRERDGLMADAAAPDDAVPTLMHDWPDPADETTVVAEPTGTPRIYDDGGA